MDNNLSYADFAAMANGNNANSQWNNPFIYLLWMMFFVGSGCFGFGGNGNAQDANNAAQHQNLQEPAQDTDN